MKEGGGWCSE